MAEAYLCIQLASALFLAGRWAANRYSARRRRETVDDTSAGDTSVEVNVEVGLECDTVEGAIMAVGAELAMKAQRKFFGSRSLRKRAITGLSPEFATHRRQVRKTSGTLHFWIIHEDRPVALSPTQQYRFPEQHFSRLLQVLSKA